MGGWRESRYENTWGPELENATLDRDERTQLLKKAEVHQGLLSQWWWWMGQERTEYEDVDYIYVADEWICDKLLWTR